MKNPRKKWEKVTHSSSNGFEGWGSRRSWGEPPRSDNIGGKWRLWPANRILRGSCKVRCFPRPPPWQHQRTHLLLLCLSNFHLRILATSKHACFGLASHCPGSHSPTFAGGQMAGMQRSKSPGRTTIPIPRRLRQMGKHRGVGRKMHRRRSSSISISSSMQRARGGRRAF
jgi:hypothetical protein